jgi:hypothetical protein
VDVLGFLVLTVIGFTACAEFGSYAFVHPVIRRLPERQHIESSRDCCEPSAGSCPR